MINALTRKNSILILLGLSLLFFFRKGIQYALIGSYIPLFVILGFFLGLLLTFQNRRKSFILLSRFWAMILIIWSSVRILFSIVQFTPEALNEFHLVQQFGVVGLVFSVFMLVIGIWLFRNLKVGKWVRCKCVRCKCVKRVLF